MILCLSTLVDFILTKAYDKSLKALVCRFDNMIVCDPLFGEDYPISVQTIFYKF